MDAYIKKILRLFLEQDSLLTYLEPASWPVWLKTSKWKPDLVLSGKAHTIIAVAVALSGNVPHMFYRAVVGRLLKDHKTLKVVVCLPRALFDQSDDTAKFCEKLGIGVRLIGLGLGLKPVPSAPMPAQPARRLPRGVGQFPQPILDRATGLNRLLFSGLLNDFAQRIHECRNSDTRTLELVNETVDALLICHPHFRAEPAPFMRMVSFENLLKTTSTNSSDHVFHSFRVFLAGCPIIDQFYDQFSQSAQTYAICPQDELHVEYIWLLTALFHDIGRPKEALSDFIAQEIQDEEISIVGKSSRWNQDHYQRARKILGSLGAFMASHRRGQWDGGAIDDQEGINLSAEWMTIYDRLDRHGVISAYDFLADILGKMTAADERKHRPFMISHAPLATLAVLLHDWRMWEHAKQWKLIPVDIGQNPLAAILIYIDTWDDYKRRPGDPVVSITEYEVNSKGARVLVEWEDEAALHAQDRKYKSFGEAITGGPPKLKIETGTGAR